MGRRTAKDTATLIEQVARGERLLEEIKDPELRETVRLALRLHKDPYSGPDAGTRSRIRSRVLQTLRPRPASLADHTSFVFEILAKPTPYAMRALAVALVAACVAGGTAVASAGSVAADPLYSVKTASEQVRLALAATPEDRAIVQLSIAEHRLAEAAALAAVGNEDEAIVASSKYGEHVASAAAELAQVEHLEPATATLVTQLQQRIDEHRVTTAAVVAKLSDDPQTAPAAAVLAVLAVRGAPDKELSPAAAIAAQAATAADAVAVVAERKVTPPRPSVVAPVATPRVTTAPTAATVRTASPRPAETARNETARPASERASKNERAAEAARKAAEEAKAAAKKAKEGSRRTPTPTPRKR